MEAPPAAMRTIKIKALLPVDFVDPKTLTLEFLDHRVATLSPLPERSCWWPDIVWASRPKISMIRAIPYKE